MKTGRKPKPAALKVAEGNLGHREIKPSIEVLPGAFEPPFPLDGIAQTEWDRILGAAFWLRETDSAAIADRCLCFQRMLESEQDIRERGLIVEGDKKSRVANPSIRIARAYRLSLQRYDSELGLTASSRSRVEGEGFNPPPTTHGKPTEPIDPLEWALCKNRPN
jgi:P27 family predicted phage terminase small subunit